MKSDSDYNNYAKLEDIFNIHKFEEGEKLKKNDVFHVLVNSQMFYHFIEDSLFLN